jgi:hypothetical protein
LCARTVTDVFHLSDGEFQFEIACDLLGCYESGRISASCSEGSDTYEDQSVNGGCALHLEDTVVGKYH